MRAKSTGWHPDAEGRTTQLAQEAHPKPHIEAVVSKVVRWLFAIVGALLTVVLVLSLVRGVSLIEMVPLLLGEITRGCQRSARVSGQCPEGYGGR